MGRSFHQNLGKNDIKPIEREVFSNADLLQNFSPVIIPKNRLFKPQASGHKSNFGDPKKPHILHFWITFCSPLVKQKLPEILSSKVYVTSMYIKQKKTCCMSSWDVLIRVPSTSQKS